MFNLLSNTRNIKIRILGNWSPLIKKESQRFRRVSKIEMIKLLTIMKAFFKKRIKLQKSIINTLQKYTKNSIMNKRLKGQMRNKKLINFVKNYSHSTRNNNKEKRMMNNNK